MVRNAIGIPTTEEIQKMTTNPIVTDDNGKPLPDGYANVYLLDTIRTFPNSEFILSPESAGLWYTDINLEFQAIIPWWRIRETVNITNSEDYKLALSVFQEQCEHVWDEQHHLISRFCQHVCVICDHREELHHDDDGSDS